MNRERLLNVARALRESPNPEKFDMDLWGHRCGAPACAFGHYAARRDLQDEFFLSANGHLRRTNHPVEYTPTGSIKEHFGLSEPEFSELFDPSGCGGAQTAIEAAQFIEAWVAARETKP